MNRGDDARGPDGPSAAGAPESLPASAVGRLKKRADFVRAARGARAHNALFSLQALHRRDDGGVPVAGVRFGFTVTKKVGGAVERNRIRRRLREAIRLSTDLDVRPGHDYVLVARRDILSAGFPTLAAELRRALRKVRAGAGPGRASGARADGNHEGRGTGTRDARPERGRDQAVDA